MSNIDIDKLDFAFQPIVNTYTGKTFAVEALLRNSNKLGFSHISDFFDYLHKSKTLFAVDNELRNIALKKFRKIKISNIKLFYNVDNRFFFQEDFKIGTTYELLKKYEIAPEKICFELTEHVNFVKQEEFINIINTYKKYGYSIAIDDFGTGVSGLHLLYISDTHFIKIDKFFIRDIHLDKKKKLFCTSIIEMAHIMGIKVIAEGVEKIEEYYSCKDLKVDYIQGFLISKPTLDHKEIKESYSSDILFNGDKRFSNTNKIDKSFIDKIDPIDDTSTLHDLFVYFKDHTKNTFVPIVDKNKKIIGAVFEVDIKQISYSQYGLSLARNNSFTAKLKHFIKPVPQIELSWGIDKALEIFHMMDDAKGIFVTDESEYYGFISLNNLLSLSYKRNLEIAQNQNPLTKLPGNKQIDIFIHNIFENKLSSHIVYFDFNDFKPFNDKYGFRQGDRAILIFSELLQKSILRENFIAHVGGDDFFVGFLNQSFEDIYKLLFDLQREFEVSVSSLYSNEDMNNNYMISKDRFGIKRKFELLSVAVAVIEIHPNTNENLFNEALGVLKKQSKEFKFPLGISILL